ncbi:MAG TPA: hypothetical protein VFD73_10780, partial [Gemmatimonadales bacterium]|nr:hypothetical protein [Gemmatimonadales bacterium]
SIWTTKLSAGYPARLFADETQVATSSAYSLLKTRDVAEPYERSREYPVFWNVGLKGRAV